MSNEFKEFMSRNGILHVTPAPYHPSTNGLAERAVQSFKQGLKRTTGKSIQDRLSRFLFQYRTTPHSTTGVPPAELLMGRRLRTRFDCTPTFRGKWSRSSSGRNWATTIPNPCAHFKLETWCMWRISLPPHPSGCQGRWSKLQDHSRTKWKWSPEQLYAGMWTMYVARVILHCLRINVARVTLNH